MLSLFSQKQASLEITYSPNRKKELKKVKKETCDLLTILIEKELKKIGGKNIEIVIPENKEFADLIVDFKIESNKLNTAINKVKAISGKSLGSISAFVS